MQIPQEISQKHIDKILNEELHIEYWEFELGVGLQYEYAPNGIRYSAPYAEMGKELWRVLKYEMHDLFCEKESKLPKEWINDLISGDARNLILGITSAITVKFDVTLGIAIPAFALIFKTGILKFCSSSRLKPDKTVKEILTEMKKEIEN